MFEGTRIDRAGPQDARSGLDFRASHSVPATGIVKRHGDCQLAARSSQLPIILEADIVKEKGKFSRRIDHGKAEGANLGNLQLGPAA